MKEICSYCKSKNTIKNGETHYGKQNHKCNTCQRQFVLGGTDWFISDSQKILVNDLLLERIPLSGISRVTKISETWLLNYIKKLYKILPDDLNADLSLPDLELYLDKKLDEEIKRLEKKSPKHAKNTPKS
jgi:hypothetical protein